MQTRLDTVATALLAATAGPPRPPAHESGVTQISNVGADMTFLDKQRWQAKIFDGTWRTADGGVTPVVEPATGDKLGTVGFAAISDLERSALRAREAQVAWAAAPFTERATVMRRAAELWAKYSDDIQGWLIRESGGTRAKTARELSDAVAECLEASALPSHALGDVLPSEKAPLSMSGHVPVGVVGVIAPFNAPVKLAIRSVAPALGLGNAVILKPDPRTPVSGGVVFARIFEEAGLPAGVLHVLPGGGDIGSAKVTSANVQAVSFTGSTTGSSTALRSSPAPVPAHPHTTTRSSAPSPRSSGSPRPTKPSIWRQTASTGST
jgi:benzaldehyde dehydrogenase (NAD)